MNTIFVFKRTILNVDKVISTKSTVTATTVIKYTPSAGGGGPTIPQETYFPTVYGY